MFVSSSLTLAGCEDGPVQQFKTAPKGAGSQWNEGQSAGSVDTSAQQGFGDETGGTNKQEICTGVQKALKWAAMMKQPMLTPSTGAGLDMTGGSTWQGLTIEQAEAINCQGS